MRLITGKYGIIMTCVHTVQSTYLDYIITLARKFRRELALNLAAYFTTAILNQCSQVCMPGDHLGWNGSGGHWNSDEVESSLTDSVST